jgi:hypothetical protein
LAVLALLEPEIAGEQACIPAWSAAPMMFAWLDGLNSARAVVQRDRE